MKRRRRFSTTAATFGKPRRGTWKRVSESSTRAVLESSTNAVLEASRLQGVEEQNPPTLIPTRFARSAGGFIPSKTRRLEVSKTPSKTRRLEDSKTRPPSAHRTP